MLRTFLRLALLLALMALTSGLGGACAPATAQGSCLCAVAEDAAPAADLSDGEIAWAAPARSAAPESAARSLPAVAGAAAAVVSGGDPPPPTVRPQPSGVAAGSAPLYLSHCAFLC